MSDVLQNPAAVITEIQNLVDRIHPGMMIGTYALTELIGVGGSGATFRAQAENGQEYAIKFLVNPPNKSEEEVAELFYLQTAILAQLDHPNVVRVHESGICEGFCFFVMDLYVGPNNRPVNLKDYAGWFGGVIAPAELLGIFRLLLSAFITVHERNIVHGNLKPENVLLQCVTSEAGGWDARIAITDFGISRVVGHDFVMLSIKKSLVHAGQRVVGAKTQVLPADVSALLQTYDYLSPEQRQGEGASRRSDVFSLGLMFLELLCGTLYTDFHPPSKMCQHIDQSWDSFILRSIAPDRAHRFRDVQEMLTAMDQLVTG